MRNLMAAALIAPLGFLLSAGCSTATETPGDDLGTMSEGASGKGQWSGDGYGDGDGYGSGDGYGDGDGYGSGDGYGDGYGDGHDGDGGHDGCSDSCKDDGLVCNVVEIAERLCDGTGLLDETCEKLAKTLCDSGHGGRKDMCLLSELDDVICGCDEGLTEPVCDLLEKKLCLDDFFCDVEEMTEHLCRGTNILPDVCKDVAIGLCNHGEHGDYGLCELPDLGEVICDCNDRGLTGDVCDLLSINLCDIDETVCDVGKVSEDVCDAIDGLSVLKCDEIARGLCKKIDIEIGDKCLIDVEAQLCDNGILDTVLEGSLGNIVSDLLDSGRHDELCEDLAVDVCLL